MVGAQQKQGATAESTGTANTHQRGTDSAPISVKLLNTGKSDSEATRETRRIKSDEKEASRAFVLTVAVVVVSVLQFVALAFTYCIMRGTARRQLSAYVGVKVTKLETGPDGYVAFKAVMRNYGQTPALDVTISMDRKILPFPLSDTKGLTETTDPDPHPEASVTINPGTWARGTSSRHRVKITESELLAVGSGQTEGGQEIQLYCYGTVRFKDVFGKSHWVNYCAMFGGEFSRREGRPSLCHLHNDTSDNPAKKQQK